MTSLEVPPVYPASPAPVAPVEGPPSNPQLTVELDRIPESVGAMPFEFSLPAAMNFGDSVTLTADLEVLKAYRIAQVGQQDFYGVLANAKFGGKPLEVTAARRSVPTPFKAPSVRLLHSRTTVIDASSGEHVSLDSASDIRTQLVSAVRVDTSARFTSLSHPQEAYRSFCSDLDVIQWSGSKFVRIQADIGYTLNGNVRDNPLWRIEVAEVKWAFLVQSDSPVFASCTHGCVEVRVDGMVGGHSYVTFTWRGPLYLVHGQRPGFEFAISTESQEVAAEAAWQPRGTYGQWGDGRPENSFLSCLRFEASEGQRLAVQDAVADALVTTLESRQVWPVDQFALRLLEGNAYSAAGGADWRNMASTYGHFAAFGGPDAIRVLRDSAEGRALLRVHNVRGLDGRLIYAAEHPALWTNRQMPHPSSPDQLLAGKTPPVGDGQAAQGIGGRNTIDGEHYEVDSVDAYLALAIDYQVGRSRRQMLELDFRRTNVLEGWGATPRDVGRSVSQACDAAALFPGMRSLLQLYCESWVTAALAHWRGKDDILSAFATGGRFLVAWAHSMVNGVPHCAPIEEALLGTSMEKFARTFPDSPIAPVARSFSYLLCRSVVQMVYDRGIAADRPGEGFHIRYLVPVRGHGQAPDPVADDLPGGADYLVYCTHALRTFLRVCQELPFAGANDRDLELRAKTVVAWFQNSSSEAQTEQAVRWGSV